jgi:type II secretory pathway component PulC
MLELRPVLRNINLLNILLLAIVLVFALSVFMPALYQDIRYRLPAAKKGVEVEQDALLQQKMPSLSDYMIISEENPFHPERKIPVEKKAEQPLPKPEFVLYGTLITDDMKMAYLEDLKAPRSTSGRGKRQVALKQGDSLSGFALKEIEAGKVVMVRGDDKIIVPIIDPSHAREGQATTVQAEQPKGQKPASKPGEVRRDRRLGSIKTPATPSPRTFVPRK